MPSCLQKFRSGVMYIGLSYIFLEGNDFMEQCKVTGFHCYYSTIEILNLCLEEYLLFFFKTSNTAHLAEMGEMV